MATTADQLTPPGFPAAAPTRDTFAPTGAGSGYQPPGSLLPPSVPPSQPRTPTPSMPTTAIPHSFTESGIFQGSGGYAFPLARILSVPVQKLSGATDIYAASSLINFPFVLRTAVLWAPASAIGGSSDGVVDVRVGPDPTATAAGFASAVPIYYPPAVAKSLYCPLQVNLGELWVPFPEGHLYLLAHGASLAGATNIQLVCLFGISPLDDFIGA